MQSTSVPQFIPTPYACTRGPYNDFYTMYWEEIAGFSCSPTKPENPMEYLFSHTNKIRIKINPAKICWDKDTLTHSLPFSVIVSILLCITQINAYVMKEKSEEYIAGDSKGIVIVSLKKKVILNIEHPILIPRAITFLNKT